MHMHPYADYALEGDGVGDCFVRIPLIYTWNKHPVHLFKGEANPMQSKIISRILFRQGNIIFYTDVTDVARKILVDLQP